MARPETHYTRNDGVHLAYQVVGNGPVDLVYVAGFITNLELQWEDPAYRRLLEKFAGFSRLILFDKRGSGLSDPVAQVPSLEQRMDDVRAVMDAVESRQAFLLGASEGGAMSALFAATYPERTRGLILYGAYPSYSFAHPLGEVREFLAAIDAEWGTGFLLRYFAPDFLSDPAVRSWWARFERLAASPGMAKQLVQMNASIDIGEVLSSIRVPTLVIHRRQDSRVPLRAGEFLANHIPGARLAVIEGVGHPIFLDAQDPIVEEVQTFVTGSRPSVARSGPDRVLATVLVAEVADAERSAAELGDTAWCGRLEAYRQHATQLLEEFQARPAAWSVRADGALVAAFDGPARAVRCAAALREAARGVLGRVLRCGLHVGEVAAGLQEEQDGGAVGGLALHVALRIAALAKPGEVLVSGTLRDLVAGSGLRFRERDARLPLGPAAGGVRLQLLSLAADDRNGQEPARSEPAGNATASEIAELTRRERQVLRLIARGLSNSAIGSTLGISENTVKRQAASVLMKLGVPTRAAAAALAARQGLA